MPLLATVGMTAAGVRAVDGDWPAVARTIGAADAVRGVVDAGNPEVARLRAAGRAAIGDRFDELLAVGRALSPADATSAIAP